MTPDQPTALVEVTQQDCEAAAALIEAYWSGADAAMMKLAASYRAGHSQGVFVRAFAAHRLAALEEAARVAWQPIETAPKDEISKLGTDGVFTAVIDWIPDNYFGDTGHARWHPITPTHWMPLPPPPAIRKAKDLSHE